MKRVVLSSFSLHKYFLNCMYDRRFVLFSNNLSTTWTFPSFTGFVRILYAHISRMTPSAWTMYHSKRQEANGACFLTTHRYYAAVYYLNTRFQYFCLNNWFISTEGLQSILLWTPSFLFWQQTRALRLISSAKIRSGKHDRLQWLAYIPKKRGSWTTFEWIQYTGSGSGKYISQKNSTSSHGMANRREILAQILLYHNCFIIIGVLYVWKRSSMKFCFVISSIYPGFKPQERNDSPYPVSHIVLI